MVPHGPGCRRSSPHPPKLRRLRGHASNTAACLVLVPNGDFTSKNLKKKTAKIGISPSTSSRKNYKNIKVGKMVTWSSTIWSPCRYSPKTGISPI